MGIFRLAGAALVYLRAWLQGHTCMHRRLQSAVSAQSITSFRATGSDAACLEPRLILHRLPDLRQGQAILGQRRAHCCCTDTAAASAPSYWSATHRTRRMPPATHRTRRMKAFRTHGVNVTAALLYTASPIRLTSGAALQRRLCCLRGLFAEAAAVRRQHAVRCTGPHRGGGSASYTGLVSPRTLSSATAAARR